MKPQRDVVLEARKKPQQARSVATVSSVLEGAAQVLESVGYEKMTTTRVAERAGTSVGTLYQYYPSKEALLVAVLEAKMERTSTAMAKVFALPASASLKDRVQVMIAGLVAEKASRPRLAAELSRQTPRLEKLRLVARVLDSAQGMVRALLEAHADEVDVDDVDAAAWLAVHAVNGMIDGAVLGSPERLEDPRFVDAIVGYVLRAFAWRAVKKRR